MRMWSRAQVGAVYAAYKRGDVEVPDGMFGGLYRYADRDVDEFIEGPDQRLAFLDTRNVFRAVVDRVFSNEYGEAVALFPGVVSGIAAVDSIRGR